MSTPPLIVIGMHRSGTSLLARRLQDAGLFLGWRQQPDHGESTFFQELNMWVMRQATSHWDRPLGTADLLATPALRALAVDYLRLSISSPRAVEFLGWQQYLRHRRIDRLGGVWGWKDPRTTFTLPLWAEIFPDLRVLHVTRHGVDVAQSLYVREHRILTYEGQRYRKRRSIFRFRPERTLLSRGPSVLEIDGGVRLWDAYVNEARRHVAELGDRALEFRYEDFLADPHPVMEKLLAFCGLDSPADTGWLDAVDDSRAYAYARDPELVDVAHRHADVLARHGYEAGQPRV